MISIILLLMTTVAWAVSAKEVDRLLYSGQLEKAATEIARWLEAEPESFEAVRRMGYLCVLRAGRAESEDQARAFRLEARQYLLRARALGDQDELASSLLSSIPKDGGETPKMSPIPEAHEAMKMGERAFSERRYQEALAFYQKAGEKDPKLYHAPLYEGDAWLRLGELDKACASYERATRIDANRETAYRYWGNALSRTPQVEQALQKYAQAVVAEPTSKMAWNRGIMAWAKARGAEIKAPKIVVRTRTSSDGQTIEVGGEELDQTLAPWLAYAATLALWRTQTFAQRYPGQAYRQTLVEEAEALTAVAKVASELQEGGSLEPDKDLALLMELHEQGLMEAFVFFSRPSAEIFEDYSDYRERHREKLVRFVVDYVVRRETF